MISLQNIKKIGYGFGFGGTNAHLSSYKKKHKLALEYFIKNLNGNFLDTSIIYGEGQSEKIIGKLNSNLKKKIFISTKVSPENLPYQKFIDSCLESIENLKVKKLDLIQPHWPNYDVDNDQIIDAFYYLKKNKKVRYFGLSNYDLKDIKYFKLKLKDDFRFIQEEYSLRNREVEAKINYCEKNNLKIVCYSPLSSGKISFNEKEKKILLEISQKTKKPISSIILNFLLSRSKNLLLIPHTSKINHLKQNMSSSKFRLHDRFSKILDKSFKSKYVSLPLKEVNYLDKNYNKIQSLNDAITNKAKLTPSPKSLANILKKGYKLKPIKLVKQKKMFYIKEGRLRFWAHVIAFGKNKKIRMLVE
jgi:aryl-alcohol dehydrogenase-like predicted oxidoreductase